MTRFIFMMLDGVGVGELPDAADYGDVGANTLGNVARLVDMRLPNLQRLGLGNIIPVRNVPPTDSPEALVGRLAPQSAGKDTTVGHWEHMGLITPRPFPTYPDGFPEEVLAPFRERIGRGILGNKPASGTAIIEELGERHMADGWPIVYTSADSVFQIAAHVEVVPLETLYEWCGVARDLLTGAHAMARVIARPFTGVPGNFVRTKDRRDFSLEPPAPLYLDLLAEAGVPVMALGKISEIYLGRGVSDKIKIGSNAENLALLLDLLRGSSDRGSFARGLLFTNLVDFDMVWGHRNDPDGFARGLEAVDAGLPAILGALKPEDRLIITADHGVDPTTRGTDHTREYVPLLYYPRPEGTPAGVYEGAYGDTGASVYAHLAEGEPSLGGRPVERLDPERGWRGYTPVVPSPADPGRPWPVKVGVEAAKLAADWLGERCGGAPDVAVVLGSGLSGPLLGSLPHASDTGCACAYGEVPGWAAGSVPGHPGRLEVVEMGDRRVVLLQGRLHGYEGYDLGELQLPVRTLGNWGVRGIVFTCAAGGIDPDRAPGDVVLVTEILDFQNPDADGAPARLAGSDPEMVARLRSQGALPDFVHAGVHAAVPGPQYETEAENEFLRSLGASCVSMSLPAEVRAAQESGMRIVALSLLTNAGVATHEDVLAGGAAAGERLAATISAVLAVY